MSGKAMVSRAPKTGAWDWLNRSTSGMERLFAYARMHEVSLSQASQDLGEPLETLKDAVMYRLAVSDKGNEYETDYQASISLAIERLRNAN